MGGGEAYKGPNFTYVFILKVDISLIMDLFCTSFDLKKKNASECYLSINELFGTSLNFAPQGSVPPASPQPQHRS